MPSDEADGFVLADVEVVDLRGAQPRLPTEASVVDNSSDVAGEKLLEFVLPPTPFSV